MKASDSTIGISVNNGTIDTHLWTGSPNTKTESFTVGRWGATGSFPRWLNGKVDELAIWNRVLTAEEVTLLYNGGAGVTYSG